MTMEINYILRMQIQAIFLFSVNKKSSKEISKFT